MRRGAIFDKRFDELVELLCNAEGTAIVDTGATTFVPTWNYILENEILQFLARRSRTVYVHSVIAGGHALTDTFNGFERLAETTMEKNVVVWLNEYFGEISHEEKTFSEFRVAQEKADRLLGAVLIAERNPNTYGDDMLSRRIRRSNQI